MRRRAVVAVLAVGMVLGACGDDDGSGEEAATTSSSTTSTTVAVTTTSEVATSSTTATTAVEGSCPDEAPVPAGATDVQSAPVAFDGDGDGLDDELTVFRDGGTWWVQVAWAAGGSGAVAIDDADMGARPLGGFDLDGDGADEAWVAIAGPASGSLVGSFRVLGCGLWPILDAGSGQPFVFPVTSSIGTFSGATCDATGDIALVTGELVDEDAGLYEAGETPYTYDAGSGEVTAGFGDGGSVAADEVGGLATLACGTLGDAL